MHIKIIVTLSIAISISLAFAASPSSRYFAETNTVAARTALIERLWRHDPTADTKLWPDGKVPMKANDKPIRFIEHELCQSNLVVSDINDPFFTFFPASGNGVKPVVIVLPGGGYWQLGWNKEGTEVANWLNGLGFSAAVLLYRAPNQRDAALCDVQRAISLLRRDAAHYAIDPLRVGLIGFSAGANLTIRAATNWRKRLYEPVDSADELSCRPDFVLPIYPWDIRPRVDGSIWKWHGMQLDPAYPVDSETPPSFTAQAEDDFCQIETAVAWDYALRLAGVSSEIRIYSNGGHGYGLRKLGTACDVWSDEAAGWLAQFRRVSRPKKVAFLGDSITDKRHIGCSKNYWGYLADLYHFDPLVYGINGDQMRGIRAQSAKLLKDHPDGVDVIFVFAGTNDFNSNVPIGEWYEESDDSVIRNGVEVKVRKREFKMDDNTFKGRINLAASQLRKDFPTARIIFMTPIHRGYAKFSDKNIQPDEKYSNGIGLFIDSYVNAVKEAGNVWAVSVIDLNSESGLYPSETGHACFFHDAKTDMLHPSSSGHLRIAEAIALRVGTMLEQK